MNKKSNKPNIGDIAAAAGVSKTTVSRYLNGRTDLMGNETRDRIKRIIELSNYQPSDIARNLKRKHTNLIGVIVSDITSPFAATLISFIGEYLTSHGYVPLFSHSDNNSEREKEAINLLLSKNVAGLIVNTASFVNPNLISVACSGIPIVLCDRYVQNYNFNVVTVDYYEAMFSMVMHLKSSGYTRPMLFSESWSNISPRSQRKDAFISAVKKVYGYNPSNDIYLIDSTDEADAKEHISKILSSLDPKDIPAIVGNHTASTVLAYRVIKSLNLKIPQDIGLCGPDDWGWNSNMNWTTLIEPHITTFTIPIKELGIQSAKALIHSIENPDKEPRELLLPAKQVIKDSTLRSISNS